MNEIARIYQTIVGDAVTFAFATLIVVWLAVGVALLFIRPLARHEIGVRLVALTPNSLATLGVLGTFTGILIGLLDFDVTRVDDSVPQLLAGLKIAFTTSIVGIAAAILFRLVRALVPSPATIEGIGAEQIHSALIDIRDDGRKTSEKSAEQLSELRRAISSDGDSSLLTQIQKLRTTIQDGQSELIREFREFAEHMVENNQKAIIEALEQVIRDFNQNLTEQFGENFKQLNEAVHQLVAWQENYRTHVDALEERLEKSVTAIEASQSALESVEAHSERIPEAIKPLEPVLNSVNTQIEVLTTHLEAIAALKDKAIEAFPVIDQNLEKITTGLATSVENALEKSNQVLSDAENAHNDLRDGYRSFLEDSEGARDRFSTELTTALKQMSDQSADEFARHGQLIDEASREAQRAITESWNESVEKLNEQFEEFDRQMQQELTRSLELLGQNLASVSEKFVSDYTPITERIREVLNIGRAVN